MGQGDEKKPRKRAGKQEHMEGEAWKMDSNYYMAWYTQTRQMANMPLCHVSSLAYFHWDVGTSSGRSELYPNQPQTRRWRWSISKGPLPGNGGLKILADFDFCGRCGCSRRGAHYHCFFLQKCFSSDILCGVQLTWKPFSLSSGPWEATSPWPCGAN